MPQLPSGTVTFVFSDIEGSTALLQRLGDDAYAGLLATHRRLVRATFGERGGHEIDTQGDAFFYSFTRARAAVAAAVGIQRAHAAEGWPEGLDVRIRLGLHTGEPAVGEEGYAGLDVVRASRIAALGRGGQVLLSEATRAIVANDLPSGAMLRALGEQQLKGVDRPEPVYELVIEGVPATSAADTPGEAVGRSASPGLAGEVVDSALQREGVPSWLRGAAGRFLPADLPVGAESHRLIEERVMAAIQRSFKEREQGRERKRLSRERNHASDPAAAPAHALPGSRSVADEIAKLRALRDAGALSDDQYERAVEQVIARG